MIANSKVISRIAALILLGAVAVQNYAARLSSPDFDAYRASIRDAAAQIPDRIGPWIGHDVPVPTRALTVLQPNVMISRDYLNIESGIHAGVLFVHCADAHHMVGHFPARCFPADGWQFVGSEPIDWRAGNLPLVGTEYEFFMQEIGEDVSGQQRIIVDNCLLRPGGLILRDMNGVSDSIVGATGQASGVGEIQFYFDASIPKAQRDKAMTELSAGYRPLIDAVLSAPKTPK
jgi:Protein of unknown function (DUF3485)